MFILDTKKKLSIIGYVISTVICVIINYIYSKFGHGVTSNYMTFMFLYPLILGTILTICNRKNNEISANLTICGISTLTIGSFIQGILEIAGTQTPFQIVYYVVGGTLIIVSLIAIRENI